MLSVYLSLCYPILLLPSISPGIRVFSNKSTLCIRWPITGASASVSVLPVNIQGWFPLGWTGLISLQSKGLSRDFSNTTVQRHQFFSAQSSLCSNSHIHNDYWKNHESESEVAQSCPTLCDPVDCSLPGSMGFSRQEYWSGLPFPSPGDLPDPGIEPRFPSLQADTLTSELPGKNHSLD